MRTRTVVGILVAVALSLSGCSMLEPGPDECRPVDEGGECFDAAADEPTWIVPLRSNGQVVAASRFLPFENEVRLGEVALYLPAREEFPTPAQNERLVIFTQVCGDPMPATCLFREHGWRIEQLRETPGQVGSTRSRPNR